MSHVPAYEELSRELRSIALLRSCSAALSWDEQTYLPPGGAAHRADQLALLAGLAHRQATSPRLGELLAQQAEANALPPDSMEAANLREAKRSYERATRLPQRLVEELSRVATLAQQAWVEAKSKSDFAAFQPWLEQTIALKREEASALGSASGNLYDALLEDYEPGTTCAEIQAIFTPLRQELVQLVTAIRESGKDRSEEILTRSYPVSVQREFCEQAARAIGFSFHDGRLDISAHPFCSGLGPGDCRLTTRYDEHHFPGAFFGTMHEAGHGIYEQGLNREQFGLACGDACSLGVHESQSRLWENFVGRSRSFWQHFYPQAQSRFPAALGTVDLDTFYQAINVVRPSWIRVEADEVTYNLHIMLRFELEQVLLSGDLPIADVPAVWNEKFESYFGLRPPTAALGCLQDVHWAAGLIGYFPTYSLGNMYAAQLYQRAEEVLGSLPELFARGEFQPLKEWLNREIHLHGRRYPAPVLMQKVTGQSSSHRPLIDHLWKKFGSLYGLERPRN